MLSVIMLSVIMLSVIMLSVIMLNVIMLSPLFYYHKNIVTLNDNLSRLSWGFLNEINHFFKSIVIVKNRKFHLL
jgi:hypothetical protein